VTVPASGPKDARIVVVGMAPAADEVRTGIPFMGAAGQILNKSLIKLGLSREKVYVTNVSNTFLAPGTSLFSLARSTLEAAVNRLKSELETVKPNVVIPLGDEPLYFLCNLHGIQKWRGSILPSTLLPGLKCVPSVHPAWIVRGMWKWEPVFTHIDLARAIAESATPEINLPIRNAITGPSLNTVLDYINEAHKHEILSVDIEVYGYSSTGTGEIACIGIGFSDSEAICIPFVHAGGRPYWDVHSEALLWRAIAKLLQDSNIKKVGQNLAFEWIYFWLHNIFPSNMWIDTMLLHHTLYPDFGGTEDAWGRKSKKDEPGHSLAFINSHCTRTPYYKDDGRRWNPNVGDHAFWKYNCMDVMVTLECASYLYEEAQAEGLWDFYCEYQQAPFPHTCRAEWYGVAIDLEKRAAASIELGNSIVEIQDRIDQKLGYHLNVQSPKQMQELLYNKMNLKIQKKRKTGKATADKETLRKFAEQTQDEVLVWIQELRKAQDLKSDIVDQKLGSDGRMHTHYKQGGTDTNRWSSVKSILGTGTNLQNIPARGLARSLFLPSTGV